MSQQKRTPWVSILLVSLVFAATGYAVHLNKSTGGSANDIAALPVQRICADDISMSKTKAKRFIKDRLNDPDSADFPATDSPNFKSRVTKGNARPCEYHVEVPVRAKNAMGAMTKSLFMVDVAQSPSDQWSAISVNELK